MEEQLQRDELGYFFSAVDEQLDRPVVLRVVRAGQLPDGRAPGPVRVRIRANAKAAAHVSHPNLVTIYEFRSLAETDIVVMEMAGGQTLQELRNAGRRWTVVEMARLLARLADALAAAHEAGLVHGNLNANNVRVKPDGRFKLLDLGIPKLDTIDDHVPHDPSDDVRGLARMACELLGPPVDVVRDAVAGPPDPLTDPTTARAHFGFLAPVLKTALQDSKGYVDGAAFRDAVLQAMEMTTGRVTSAGDMDRGFSTHVLGPVAIVPVEDALPADSRTLEPINPGGRPGGPRLVLPPDLAGRAPAQPFHPDHIRLAPRPARIRERIGRFFTPRVTIAAVLVGAVGIAITIALRRDAGRTPVSAATLDPQVADSGETVVIVSDDPPDGTQTGASAGSVPGDDTVSGTAAAPASSPPMFGAAVRASPPGTTIRSLDGPGGPWDTDAQISVPAGDTIVLEFSHPGYVTQRRPFTGSRLTVSLRPDSVLARFRANVAADVFLVTPTGEVRLGTTNVDVRLPSGNHRIVYRAPGQSEWRTTSSMTTPGGAYDVVKDDYVTVGTLVVAVSGTWARVSVDGGQSRETPARFEALSAGSHVITLSRQGFATVVDTVIVEAGGVTSRTYEIRR